ncbi:MAG: HlyD family efflux transporter periplasmic adaptor subunit [Betaproteobacteria bacterium]
MIRIRFAATILGLLALAACGEKAAVGFQGYAEGEYVLVAAPAAGKLEKRWVSRGQEVEAGAPLFTLEDLNEKASRREAGERVHNAEAKLANIAAGKRKPELDAIQAQEAQAAAARELSTRRLTQQEALHAKGFLSAASLDEARSNHKRDIARVAETEAQIRLARMAIGRDKEIAAAQADVETARAVLAQSDWRLAQRAIAAPAKALVQDTLYSEGEWVAAGSPVVSLLPPGNLKLRFFVPETALGGLKIGQAVHATCDGCNAAISARISYISRQAEYTPPVIYSRDQRSKLVFLVEARPEPADAMRLKPGQPLDVLLN